MRNLKIPVPELRDGLAGRVIEPEDDGYEEARTVFYGGFDRRPAAIVRVANADDVARVVTVARESELELAVRSGGHSLAGHSVSDGGIVIDLSEMKALEIDVKDRTAWAQTGLTAGEYTTAAAEHDLATGFGDTASVGIGGITLGGGVGYLVRKHGLTIDDLLAAEVVTADGRVRQVDDERDPELFWAIRGGGGNFGVATRFRFRLHELPQVVGGMLFLPATPDVVASFVEAAEAAPEELSAIANVMPAPPAPFIPEAAHGKTVLMALIMYAGDVEAGQRAVAPFRALAEPIADMLRPMRYPEIYPPNGQEEYHPVAAGHNMFVGRIDRDHAATILEHLERSTATIRVAQLRVLGGAMARVPADATAFAHRSSRIMVNIGAVYERPEDGDVHRAWVRGLADALDQGSEGAYVNFVADEGSERVRASYPGATWDRLVRVKRTYDPTNLFRLNQNIPPSG
ncbi:MAG TPA: FAD-binding oxidoreductase [Actinomycetota bacterium]|nr:FAD-binding oxidoreductase [Actinomycetota bacterium]